MKWLILSVTLLFVAGCQSTGSETSSHDQMNKVDTSGCSS
ncbi:Lipoprotein [Vibrio crassostreae]|nr:Lipoprotein [Vibrio crassostreae]CAK2477871.1 Lipoprotein [Vibrio crassostreae]CAK2703662.1 Lipoprotein [Vibrio crassostreae]